MRELERFIVLQVVDTRWREHLENMDYLREGVHLRAMAQKDPLVEYTSEGEAMFREMGGAIREEVILHLFHAQLEPGDAEDLGQPAVPPTTPNGGRNGDGLVYQHESMAGADAIAAAGLGATAGGFSEAGGSVATQPRKVAERE